MQKESSVWSELGGCFWGCQDSVKCLIGLLLVWKKISVPDGQASLGLLVTCLREYVGMVKLFTRCSYH